jgi:K(+)-stimulated pyrophosphate-energized sodium pump
MANAGGAWDNAKKIVETELRAKGTELHAATIVGDTVGDPFKDTSSVALNPVIKFTTLFGVLAVGLALELHAKALGNDELGNAVNPPAPTFDYVRYAIAGLGLAVSMFFAWRSFYGMRIGNTATAPTSTSSKAEPPKPETKPEPPKPEPETSEAAA